jgi:predicted TIM-barrel fold metal-dependent hydrolase
MASPWDNKTQKYFQIVNEINESFKTYDVHLHPTDIISNLLDYKEVTDEEGLFSLGGGNYVHASLEKLPSEDDAEEMSLLLKRQPHLIPMLVRRTYNFSGPRVFLEYFHILGINKGLLLPVAPAVGSIEPQMAFIHRAFKNSRDFLLAGSIPNTVRNEDVLSFMLETVKKYKIIAVKIHPNITAIDLNEASGKERIECIVEASAQLGLPMVIHGGRSYLPDRGQCGYASIKNFLDINLTSAANIIIAHGGAYGHSADEIIIDVIPPLRKLLSSNENIYIDISGLNYRNVSLLLRSVEIDRILFGSDALYENQIMMLMRLMSALEDSKLELEDSLLRILSHNPAKVVFKEDNCITRC